MKREYMRTAKNSYMIVRDADFAFEPYELQMVLHNKIGSLIPMQVIVSDGKAEYWFDVTGLRSLDRQLSVSPADGLLVRRLLEGICTVKTQMEEYLLDGADINYQSAYVFWNQSKKEMQFCYIPGYKAAQAGSVKLLLEELLQHLDHSDPEAVRMAYDLYEQCDPDDAAPEVYRQCLYGMQDKEPVIEEQKNYSGRPAPEMPPELIVWENEPDGRLEEQGVNLPSRGIGHEKKRHRFFRKEKRQKAVRKTASAPDFSELSQDNDRVSMVAEPSCTSSWGETVCLSEELPKLWELEYVGSGIEKNLSLTKFPFMIGTNSRQSDGVLYAQTVSRLHACLTEGEGELLLEDFNSTNGTYLNGHLIPMNTPKAVREGDRLIFGTEEYILRRRCHPQPAVTVMG